MKLTPKMYLRIWEHALEQLKMQRLEPGASTGLFLARCWTNAFVRTMSGEGCKLYVKKDEDKIEELDLC